MKLTAGMLFSICTRLGPTPRALKYQDLRQKHQSAISEARMRSRLGISISVGTLDLIECGPAVDEDQSPHDHIPALFYRRAFDAGEATICGPLFSRDRLSTTGRRTSAG